MFTSHLLRLVMHARGSKERKAHNSLVTLLTLHSAAFLCRFVACWALVQALERATIKAATPWLSRRSQCDESRRRDNKQANGKHGISVPAVSLSPHLPGFGPMRISHLMPQPHTLVSAVCTLTSAAHWHNPSKLFRSENFKLQSHLLSPRLLIFHHHNTKAC